MNIPIYNQTNLVTSLKDGNYEYDDFADFISQLLQERDELTPKERGIINKTNSEGTYNLNENEMNSLKKIVMRYKKKCGSCDTEISLNEVFHTGICCSSHSYMEN